MENSCEMILHPILPIACNIMTKIVQLCGKNVTFNSDKTNPD